jgi:VWFA-related protein
MMPRAWPSVTVSAAAWATVSLNAGQQTPPQFRSGVETVAVHATVLDRYGSLVPDLKEEEFEVLDDGRRQTLTLFGRGLQPITAIVLLDTSASMTPALDLARLAAEQFVIRLLPHDRALIGSFSDSVTLGAAFTDDRDELLRSIREDVHVGNPTRLWDALDVAMTALRPETGRRVILLFTDGQDTVSDTRASALLERARVEELMVYAVQFRTRVDPVAEMSGVTGRALFRDRTGEVPPTEALRRISTQTGGGHFVLGEYDDVSATFTQVAQELRDQYTLGFAPRRLDGRIHRLDVRVTRPGTVVRARQSYFAPAPDEP